MKLHGVKEAMQAIRDVGYQFQPADLRNMVKYAISAAKPQAESGVPRGSIPHSVSSKGVEWPVVPPYAYSQVIVKARVQKDKQGAYALLGIRKPAFYANFFERGTNKENAWGVTIPAKPWLLPAFEANTPEIIERMKGWLRRKLKRVKKRMAK